MNYLISQRWDVRGLYTDMDSKPQLLFNTTPILASIWKAWSLTSRAGIVGPFLETLPLPPQMIQFWISMDVSVCAQTSHHRTLLEGRLRYWLRKSQLLVCARTVLCCSQSSWTPFLYPTLPSMQDWRPSIALGSPAPQVSNRTNCLLGYHISSEVIQ